MTPSDLIYDIGMHDGTDTRYYLNAGWRVVAIDANPDLVEQARVRFAPEISRGRLTCLNLGIGGADEVRPFYVCESKSAWSSFDPEWIARAKEPYHIVEIPCRRMDRILAEHGSPHYIKIDVEGWDLRCLDGLSPSAAPPYLSLEIALIDGLAAIDRMESLGYTGFKLINQQTHTVSLPVFRREYGWRALRWACDRFTIFYALFRHLPAAMRPRRILFDPLRPRTCDSGPFGEATDGLWIPSGQTRKILHRIQRLAERDGAVCWFDLHARHRMSQPSEAVPRYNPQR